MLLLERCNISECEARCCYDGAYLVPDDEFRIREAIGRDTTFFAFLPLEPFVVDHWLDSEPGLKTDTRPWEYQNLDFPAHFEQTRCVFAFDDGHCSLQVFADRNNEHPWTYKPLACWMHPLRMGSEGLDITTINQGDTHDGYPGYTSFTPCGRHRSDGRPWREVLAEEIEYHESKRSAGLVQLNRSVERGHD